MSGLAPAEVITEECTGVRGRTLAACRPKRNPFPVRVRNRLRKWSSNWDRLCDELYLRALRISYSLPSVPVELLAPETTYVEPILDDVCMPPYFNTSGHDDIRPLMRLLKSRQPRIVLELGTAYGTTVANICKTCPEAKVYTVNALPEQQTGDVTTFAVQKTDIGRVYRSYGYGNRVVQIFANTLELNLSKYLPEGTVDVAIIDACHDCDYVLNDFLKVRPFIRPGGFVLLHDTHPTMELHLRGSYEACMTLRCWGYEMLHIRNTWWGYWKAAAENPDTFSVLSRFVDRAVLAHRWKKFMSTR